MFNKFILTFVLLFATCTFSYTTNSNRVLLQDIEAVTFKTGGLTTDLYPQISCKGLYCDESWNYDINSIQCVNKGFDGKGIQWECSAVVNNKNERYTYKISNYQVTCKGYDYPDDPYILHGSCSVEYTLDRNTNKPTVIHHPQTETIITHHDYTTYYDEPSDPLVVLFVLLFILFILFLLACAAETRVVCVNDRRRVVRAWNPYYYTHYRTPTVYHSTTVINSGSSSGSSGGSMCRSGGYSSGGSSGGFPSGLAGGSSYDSNLCTGFSDIKRR